MTNEILRPNGELGTVPCFKCNRIGLPTAAADLEPKDPSKAMCNYHEDVARFGKTLVDGRIDAGHMQHPVEFARKQSRSQTLRDD